MTPSSWTFARRVVAAAAVLAVIAVAIALLVLAATSGVPKGWWPHTGRAFAAGTHATDQDPCDLIAGPGKAYCERRASIAPALGKESDNAANAAAVRLVPAGAGVVIFVAWRRHCTTRLRWR